MLFSAFVVFSEELHTLREIFISRTSRATLFLLHTAGVQAYVRAGCFTGPSTCVRVAAPERFYLQYKAAVAERMKTAWKEVNNYVGILVSQIKNQKCTFGPPPLPPPPFLVPQRLRRGMNVFKMSTKKMRGDRNLIAPRAGADQRLSLNLKGKFSVFLCTTDAVR